MARIRLVFVAPAGPHCHLERSWHNDSNYRRGHVCDYAKPRRLRYEGLSEVRRDHR